MMNHHRMKLKALSVLLENVKPLLVKTAILLQRDKDQTHNRFKQIVSLVKIQNLPLTHSSRSLTVQASLLRNTTLSSKLRNLPPIGPLTLCLPLHLTPQSLSLSLLPSHRVLINLLRNQQHLRTEPKFMRKLIFQLRSSKESANLHFNKIVATAFAKARIL